MNAAQKIAAFVAGLAVVFGVAVWVGKAVGPEGRADVRQTPHEDSHSAHSTGVTSPGPAIGFYTTFPSAGQYRMFLDFQHGGLVRTAEFTVSVADGETR